MAFLDKTFYGNTFGQWLTTLAIILAVVILGRILYWIADRVLKKITSKTKGKIDDIIVDMVEEPLVFGLVLMGIWFALARLTLPPSVDVWIPKIFYGLVTLSVAWALSRMVDAIIREYITPMVEKSDNDLDDQLLPFLRKGLKMGVWILAVIVAMNNAGYQIGALLAGIGIGGIALAMAAKDTVANLFGGFTVFMDRPFRLGDRVVISGIDGTVKDIGIRSTRLVTLDGRVVSVPNSKFTNGSIENISSEPNRKIKLNLGLTYDTTPEKMERAMEILKEIGAANCDLEEKLSVGFNAFGDFAMNILMVYYIRKGSDILGTQNAVNMEVLKRFNAEGLEMAFPTQTIYKKEL